MLLICLHAVDVHDFHDTVTAINSLIDSLFLSHKLSVSGLRRVKTEIGLLRAVLHPVPTSDTPAQAQSPRHLCCHCSPIPACLYSALPA